MFYVMYLTGLCQRRHWPDPLYECTRTRSGRFTCTVRVNNREYTSDAEYESDELARDAAATRAYLICRHFSVNDGMFPGQRQGQGGVVQGLPVAIGTGRRRGNANASGRDGSDSVSSNGSSGGSDSGRSISSSRRGNRTSDGGSSMTSIGRGSSNFANTKIKSTHGSSSQRYRERPGAENSGGSSPRSSDSGLDNDILPAFKGTAIGKTIKMGRKMNQNLNMGLGEVCRCGHVGAQLYGQCGSCLRQSGW